MSTHQSALRRGPQTVIIAAATPGGTKTITTAPTTTARSRLAPTTETVKDHASLLRLLIDLHRQIDHVHEHAASVLNGSVFLQGVTLTAGANYIEHHLGRAYVGVLATVSETPVSALAAVPAGYDKSRFVAIGSTSGQVVSFLVF